MKIFFWLIPLFLILNGCDYKKRKALKIFEEHCQNAGLFIYEKSELNEEFFVDEETIDFKEKSNRFLFGNGKYLNMDVFERHYIYVYAERKYVSDIGDIYIERSHIVRKSDSKLLSEAISVKGFGGGLTQRDYTKKCPKGRGKSGNSIDYENSNNLIQLTFIKNIKE